MKEGELLNLQRDSKQKLRGKIIRDPSSIIVAVENGHAVGNVLTVDDGWRAWIFRLAVRKSHRNRGIGVKLMKEAERRLKNKGYDDVDLFIQVNRGDLLHFYNQLGYKEFRKWTPMRKKL